VTADRPDPDELIRRVYDKRGYLFEWHVLLSEYAPEFVQAYENVFESVVASGAGELPRKYRECVYSAVLSVMGEEDTAKNHMHKALEAGASVREVIDAILTAWNPSGSITLCHGLKALSEVLTERGLHERRDVPYRVTDRPEHADRVFGEEVPT
jgi:4-carboxymuconolactone decarboxylase